ncbi:WXG100 family type VII secretion target [Microbacterium testaceum]|uniref:WXG100 family type VII secretion target n=1 Tax=Microbacterium testaceum TaxID=2033 RepID=UPI003D711AE5
MISLDTEQHAQFVDRLRGATREIRAELDELSKRSSELRSQWTGEARQEYDRAQAEWMSAVRAMEKVLDETTKSLEVSRAILQAAEVRVSALWQ